MGIQLWRRRRAGGRAVPGQCGVDDAAAKIQEAGTAAARQQTCGEMWGGGPAQRRTKTGTMAERMALLTEVDNFRGGAAGGWGGSEAALVRRPFAEAGGAESQQRGRPLGARVQPARSRRPSYAAAGSEVGVAPAARDEWPGGCLDRRRPLHIHR